MAKTKPWGTTETLYLDDRVHVERIAVKCGGYCSRHYHRNKCNAFWVLDGVLAVIIDGHETVYLGAHGGILSVPAGQVHQFIAMSAVDAIEIYRAFPETAIDLRDIHRFSEGGIASDPRVHDNLCSRP